MTCEVVSTCYVMDLLKKLPIVLVEHDYGGLAVALGFMFPVLMLVGVIKYVKLVHAAKIMEFEKIEEVVSQ